MLVDVVDAHGVDAHGGEARGEGVGLGVVREGLAEREVGGEEAQALSGAVDEMAVLHRDAAVRAGGLVVEERHVRDAGVGRVAAHGEREERVLRRPPSDELDVLRGCGEDPAVFLELVDDGAEVAERLVAPLGRMPLEHDVVAGALSPVLADEGVVLDAADGGLEVAGAAEGELAAGVVHVAVEPGLDFGVFAEQGARLGRDEAAGGAEALQRVADLLKEDALRLVERLALVGGVRDAVFGEIGLAVLPGDVHLVGPAMLPEVEKAAVAEVVLPNPLDVVGLVALQRVADDAEGGGKSALRKEVGDAPDLGMDAGGLVAVHDVVELDEDVALRGSVLLVEVGKDDGLLSFRDGGGGGKREKRKRESIV